MKFLLYAGIVIQLCFVIEGLRLFNCTSIHAPHIGCEVYLLNKDECSPPNLETEFPHLYTDGLEYPEKPHDFHVDISYKYYPTYFNASYPCFNITIRPPITSSYKDVKGFEVTYMELIAGNTEVKCLIFNLTGKITTTDKENRVAFRAELVCPVSASSDYLLRAYSLPKPAAHYDVDMSLSALIHAGPPFNTTAPSSAYWTTTIMYRNYSQEIYYSFQGPPLRFNFEHFIVSLYNVSDRKQTSGLLVQRQHITEYSGVFIDLLPGWYRIKILPEDPYYKDQSKCLCRDNWGSCVSCSRTMTAAIYIHEPPTTTPSPSITQKPATEKPSSLKPATQEPSSRKEDKTGKIIGAVVGSFLGVILIVILILFFIMYRRRLGGKQDPEPGKYVQGPYEYQGQINANFMNDEKPKATGNTGPRLLKRQNVFLVNTEDHPKHLAVLKAFATFLQKECSCDVTFAPDCKIDDKPQWVLRSMEMADYILVVQSSAAYLQCKSLKQKKGELCYQPLTKVGDIFVPALQIITNCIGREKDVRKFLSVQFPYTPDKFVMKDLFPGKTYNIPTHLDEFLCCIHGLHNTQSKLEEYNLPVRVSIRLRPPGMNLIDAINEAADYESMLNLNQNSSTEKLDSGIGEDDTYSIGSHSGGIGNSNGPANHTFQNNAFPNSNYDYAFQDGNTPNQLSTESPTTPGDYEYVDVKINQGPQKQFFPTKRNELQNMWTAPDELSEDIPAYLEVEGGNFSFHPHPPSQLGEEDVQSTQLRDEIRDINTRYMTTQLRDSNPEVEECQSLGGMSV
ncbi:uncharacterized protein LOC132558440 [Ylistrum balloti]|uniref:uncharacterized protein LOC132558440 n=1 Tax=Ylistrum balloti TaxID=509963 RepID=UPI0029058437|nr:uncharacterized protein LOC132558440 [Ylistrum balloti]